MSLVRVAEFAHAIRTRRKTTSFVTKRIIVLPLRLS